MVHEVTNTSPKRHQLGGLSRQQRSQPHRKLGGLKPISFGLCHLTLIPEKERKTLPMRTCSLPQRLASGISNRSASDLCPCAVSCVGPAHLGQLSLALLQTAGGSHKRLEQSGRSSKNYSIAAVKRHVLDTWRTLQEVSGCISSSCSQNSPSAHLCEASSLSKCTIS